MDLWCIGIFYEYLVDGSLNWAMLFPDPQRPIINILYGWSGSCIQFGLCVTVFFLITSSKLILLLLNSIKIKIYTMLMCKPIFESVFKTYFFYFLYKNAYSKDRKTHRKFIRKIFKRLYFIITVICFLKLKKKFSKVKIMTKFKEICNSKL